MSLTLLRKLDNQLYGDWQWAATYYYKCPNGQADFQAAALLGSELATTGASRIYVPLCSRIQVKKSAFPGLAALVVAHFTSFRRTGVATIRGQNKPSPGKTTRALNGDIIEGPDPDGKSHWRVTKGSNVIGKSNELVVVQAAYERLDLATPRLWRNKVNAGAMPRLQAAPGVLLLWDYIWKPVYAGPNTRFYFDYYFRVSPECDDNGNPTSWNNSLYSCKSVYIAMQVPLLDMTQTYVSEYRTKVTEVANKEYAADQTSLVDSVEEPRALFQAANMGSLDNMIVW